MKALAVAVLSALAIQPVVFLCWIALPYVFASEVLSQNDWSQILAMAVYVLIFAAAHLVVLGLPAFFLLRYLNLLTWPNMLLVGFIAGSIVMAVIGWPLGHGEGFSSSSSWHGKLREMTVDGVPTLYGWLSYLEGILLFGLQGIAGATAFYWAWRRYAT